MSKNNFDLFNLSDYSDNQDELIQIIPTNQETVDDSKLPDSLPILPIRNTVLFPGVVVPLTVTRTKSIQLVKKAHSEKGFIGAVAQKNKKVENPALVDLYDIGTIAKIIKIIVLPDGSTTIIIQGQKRFKVDQLLQEKPHQVVSYSLLKDTELLNNNSKSAIFQTLKETATKVLKLSPEMPSEASNVLNSIEDFQFFTYFLASNINQEDIEKQKLLEMTDPLKRASQLLEYMYKDLQVLELKKEIQDKVHVDIDQQQRDYYLRQQMRVLQDELGSEGLDQDVQQIKKKGEKKSWSKHVKEHFEKEISKITRMNSASAEYSVAVNYLELLVDLPWSEETEDNFDLHHAKKVLDRDHYGLDKVKERIIEYLAVRKIKRDIKGPILCLYGPPGVGKTSLGKSIAKALGKEYVRFSLGGISDEAEIRGHRKTYIGAMPGKIIQNINRAGTSNPVFILDEIDKVNSDFRGDPSSALLEVLDPEQNDTFKDNYLEVDYDLSKVLFIATANSLDHIQPPLLDRMEIIDITGYTVEEKIEIAKKHLIPKQRKEHGLKGTDMKIPIGTLTFIVNEYTKESGVRTLEKRIASVTRFVAKSIAMEEEYDKNITIEQVMKVLGADRYEYDNYEDNSIPGIVTGLAWTPVGGDILFIESSLYRGSGKFTLSGQLGSVMKESVMAALTYLKTHSEKWGIDYRIFNNYDLHVHVPAGAVPKDGPSAGITMLTSLASVFTQRKVKKRIALTGEITLRGKVLPVGGIKEKILAAKRAKIKEIILSKRNKKDIDEIQEHYLRGLTFHYVESAFEVLEIALTNEKAKEPIQFILSEPSNN